MKTLTHDAKGEAVIRRAMILPILLMTILSALWSFSATADYSDDDSCVTTTTLFDRIVNNLSSLGTFEVISSFFSMTDSGAEGGILGPDGRPLIAEDGTALTRCRLPSEVVCFRYDDTVYDAVTCLGNGDSQNVGTVWSETFKGAFDGDRICIQADVGFLGWTNIGCKYRPMPSNKPHSAACFVSSSCGNDGYKHAKSFFPLSSMVISCLRETLVKIFQDPRACAGSQTRLGLLPSFQEGLRKAVMAALSLYVVLFGFKVMLGQEVPKKAEIFMFILKMILVIYFSVGFYKGVNANGDIEYNHGVLFLFNSLLGASNSFANMLMQAGSANGLCAFPSHIYPASHEYLALWDSLDCRIGYYLGMDNTSLMPSLLISFIPLILVGQIVFVLLSLVFTILMVLVTIEVVMLTAVALIAMSLILYMAPLFVPMALFKHTRSYFDNWVKLLIAYTLQPTVVVAFVALMLTVFDTIVYSTCKFHAFPVQIAVLGMMGAQPISIGNGPPSEPPTTNGINYRRYRNAPFFDITMPSGAATAVTPEDIRCEESYGFASRTLTSASSYEDTDALLFTVKTYKGSFSRNMITALLSVCLYSYLFYLFLGMLSGLAADLMGGTNLGGMTFGAHQMITAAGKGIQKRVNDARAKARAKEKEARNNKKRKGGGA